jgi:hypothetical protein
LKLETNSRFIHQKYSQLIGAKYIATPKALRIIERLVQKRLPEDLLVVELGTGIGTIADLVLSIRPFTYIAYEKDSFCVKQLKENLSDKNFILCENFVKLIDNIKSLESFGWALLIVDEFVEDDLCANLLQILLDKTDRLIIFVEGHRFNQRLFLTSEIRVRKTGFIAKFYGNSRDSVKGGYLLELLDSNSQLLRLLQKVYGEFCYLRLSLQSKHLSRRVLQAIGLRKNLFLSYLPRLRRRS